MSIQTYEAAATFMYLGWRRSIDIANWASLIQNSTRGNFKKLQVEKVLTLWVLLTKLTLIAYIATKKNVFIMISCLTQRFLICRSIKVCSNIRYKSKKISNWTFINRSRIVVTLWLTFWCLSHLPLLIMTLRACFWTEHRIIEFQEFRFEIASFGNFKSHTIVLLRLGLG